MAQQWELQQWAIPRVSQLLPLTESEIEQIVAHAVELPDEAAEKEFHDLLGDSDDAVRFRREFLDRKQHIGAETMASTVTMDSKATGVDAKVDRRMQNSVSDVKGVAKPDVKANGTTNNLGAPPPYVPQKSNGQSSVVHPRHTNKVIEAATVRAKDEQEMQQALQNLQYSYRIYNSDIEPEHDVDYPCGCAVCRYKMAKWRRYPVQKMWSEAVMYPGEKAYNDNTMNGSTIFTRNPYQFRVNSPFGYNAFTRWSIPRPIPSWHARAIHQTISLNNSLNKEAQADVDAREPKHSVWDEDALETAMSSLSTGDRKQSVASEKKPVPSEKAPFEKASNEKRPSLAPSMSTDGPGGSKPSKFASFRKSIGIKSTEERAVSKVHKAVGKGNSLRDAIVAEEQGRWPDGQWHFLVTNYQEKVGMTRMIADLRARKPTQYLHLLRAGYFEPIPVAWATQASNPLKFSIEAAAGWRGITPAWRGYEDTAEERLYWVLNHREGSVGMRMKPDFISELNMARERMARAVEPPPIYWSDNDTCHLQHTSTGYSKQVMPSPYQAYDRPEVATDDTMILLDVSGSMDFEPQRPLYDQYTVMGFAPSPQPKNKDVAKSIVRRFVDAMANHDHQNAGYDLTTFSTQSSYIGTVNHRNLDQRWKNVRFGGGTRVMTGWQKVKDLHFQKHSESATHHPVYGWQAGPETPMLRLLLLLDGEATDMDEFELDLLGLSWAHVTIFLIGVDGCPHHHRHANELQRISDVNHHVSFVDAQGNCPERFVTHELLKRHLGYDVSMREFEEMEELPAYQE